MDGLLLAAAACEMQAVIGSRIEKIYQPEKDEILWTLHTPAGNRRLLLSANPNTCRVQLTGAARENPAEPPMFCMLLRKYIQGGRIVSVTQEGLDRVLTVGVLSSDPFGESAEYALIAEIMGKHSNMILVGGGKVLGVMKPVGAGVSSVRQLLPGLPYRPPPAQQKKDPRLADEAAFIQTLSCAGRIDQALSAAFSGLSPKIAAALAARETDAVRCEALSPGEAALLARALRAFYADVARGVFAPSVTQNDAGEALSLLPFPPAPQTPHTAYPSASLALDAFYERRDQAERMRRRSASMAKVIQNNIERCEKKLALQQETLLSGNRLDELRQYGELILANLHQLKRGPGAVLENYYCQPPQRVEIPLDESRSPAENAQRYFKKYQKLKGALEMAGTQREQTLAELFYLEGVQDSLANSTGEAELLELREELIQQGYLRAKKEKKAARVSKPMRFCADDGAEIFVGKNNAQNDRLTLRFARAEDLFLHAKNIPGSHVILRCADGPPGARALEQAALLAAYYSKGRAASVPVDYTPRKHVKKPGGARPGFVIYETNRTVLVKPDEASVKAIRRLD